MLGVRSIHSDNAGPTGTFGAAAAGGKIRSRLGRLGLPGQADV